MTSQGDRMGNIPTCCLCGTQPKGKKGAAYVPKLLKTGELAAPRGWKRSGAGLRCPACTQANYLNRSIRVRLVNMANDDWSEFAACRQHLAAASGQVAQFSNWLLQQLLAADLAMAPYAGNELPPCPKIDYYDEATRLFPAIAPRGLCTAAQMVTSYYRERRFAVLVAKQRNVDTYRWDGLPVPVSNQAWKIVSIDAAGILLRIQGAAGKSWLIKAYADGINWQRMKQLFAGEAEGGAAFFVRRARKPQPGEPRGATRKRSWFLRISARVPKPSFRKSRGVALKVLTLGHDAESLLFGVTDDPADEPLELPALDLRTQVAGHIKRDAKRQIDATTWYRQMPARKRRRWAARRRAACDKANAKVAYTIKCVAAELARMCEARGIGEVNYDTTDRGFLPRFPYFKLRSAIACALENAGIMLHVTGAAGADEDETNDPPETNGHCQAEERNGCAG